MITFDKYHASGNHFIVFYRLNDIYANKERIRYLCRNDIIGADGIIYLLRINDRHLFRIFNRDGSEAVTCGNGLRIAAKILSKDEDKEISIYALDGEHMLKSHNDICSVSFKIPQVISSDSNHALINNGNLHEVNIVDEFDLKILKHDEKINHTQVKINSRTELELITDERGVGLTSSCGSASIATFRFLRLLGLVDQKVTIINKKGNLTLEEKQDTILSSGHSIFVYRGEFNDEIFE